MTTDLSLKLALAKELPELIEIHSDAMNKITGRFFWLDTGKEVTEREWDWVVNRCLEKLNVCGGGKTSYGIYLEQNWPNKEHIQYRISHATWQQRAEAFLKTLGKWEEV